MRQEPPNGKKKKQKTKQKTKQSLKRMAMVWFGNGFKVSLRYFNSDVKHKWYTCRKLRGWEWRNKSFIFSI